MSQDILITLDDAVLEITFNRPAKKNALTNAMYGEIAQALKNAKSDPKIRAILFMGNGGLFSAGNDIHDFAAIASGAQPAEDMKVLDMLKALATLDKPVVAAVEGLAIGVGTTLLLHCDLVYAAEDAQLSTPFVDLALVPEAASSYLLPAALGHRRAYAMFCLGESLSGRNAAELGLINRAVKANEVMTIARSKAKELTQKAPGALAMTKALMRDSAPLCDRINEEAKLFGQRLKSPEAREAFMAFIEKRKPDFGSV